MNVPEITNSVGLRMRLGSIVLVHSARLASWEGVVAGICCNNGSLYIKNRVCDVSRHCEHMDNVEMVMVF